MSYQDLLALFQGKKALVVGDLMLDEYIFGSAARISPEAPVMVIRQERTRQLPGGAANVALNLKALGADTSVVGLVGADEAGMALDRALVDAGLQHGMVIDPERVTTRKTRIVADHKHQVLRVDHESVEPAQERIAERVVDASLEFGREADVIVLSDYLKGALTASIVAALREQLPGKVIVANPKPSSLDFYRGIDLVSLNRLEAAGATGKAVDEANASDVARALVDQIGTRSVLVTLGEAGMAAASKEAGYRIPAPRVEVYDTAGAGDTVIATVALGLAVAGFEQRVFELAAATAASVVRRVGVATPTADDLAQM